MFLKIYPENIQKNEIDTFIKSRENHLKYVFLFFYLVTPKNKNYNQILKIFPKRIVHLTC